MKADGLDGSDAKRLKALKLKAEAMLDNAILSEISTKGDARHQARGVLTLTKRSR